MTITPEELAAFADGELTEADKARVAAAVAADAALARELEAHRALKIRLAGHFAPRLDEPVPDRLKLLLGGAPVASEDGAQVIDFGSAREKRNARRLLPAWGWSGGAIAASLVAVVALTLNNQGGEARGDYADTRLATVLDEQLTAQSAANGTQILLSFRNGTGEYCRAYSSRTESGIACRDETGWRMQAVGAAGQNSNTEFRMAGSKAEILAAAKDLATGEPLNAEQEVAARASGWR